MLALGVVVAFLTVIPAIALLLREHAHDDIRPGVRDYAAFRAALAATGRARDHLRV
jgi:hypothetical protein